jgi:SAM-dependent methyltransferase
MSGPETGQGARERVPYPGKDLEALAFAPRYHAWILALFRPFIGHHAVEVGAGSGNFTRLLAGERLATLDAIEPSDEMFPRLAAIAWPPGAVAPRLHHGSFAETRNEIAGPVDTIFYVNVLEHIEEDRNELALAFASLAPGGRLLLFVPALPALYGSHDRLVGHFRRYHRAELEAKCRAAGFRVRLCRYFDCLGILPWWLKYRVLRSERMEPGAVALYDRLVVPVARLLERVVPPPIGKNLLLVAEKPDM